MAADKQKQSGNPKIFDVSRPGRTPADASSRPVITNRKTVEDPDISAKPLMNPKQKITVKPSEDSAKPEPEPSEPKASDQKKEQIPPGAPELPASEDDQDKISVKTQSDEPKQPEPEESPTAPPEQPEPEPEPEPAKTTTGDEQKDEEAENIGKAAIDDSLASSGEQSEPENQQSDSSEKSEPLHMGMPQEFTPAEAVVSQHHKHRTLWFELLSILIILLLLAAITSLLLDAGIISTDLDIPHTDFFRDGL